MYETPLTIAYADELDDYSMRVVFEKVDYYIKHFPDQNLN